ncbi:hypothetical protein GCM10009760_42720 [Kitasatospora kazusensis]|uniref:Uncharacterized protein n=1 Tax=Kitasatospora kazusensis TaxID=407974 RepID=A0ABN2ZX76_9ACTN
MVRSGGSPEPGCVTVTTGRPTIMPEKETTPGAAARTVIPSAAARSTPRCPAAQRMGGASNRRSSPDRPPTGQARPSPGPVPLPAAESAARAIGRGSTSSSAVSSSISSRTCRRRSGAGGGSESADGTESANSEGGAGDVRCQDGADRVVGAAEMRAGVMVGSVLARCGPAQPGPDSCGQLPPVDNPSTPDG